MDKGIGFNRPIRLPWLDIAASLLGEGIRGSALRARLNSALANEIESSENRRKTIDILVGIWERTSGVSPTLHAYAVESLPAASAADRLFLHYGLTLLRYPFVRSVSAAIGQLCRVQENATPGEIKQRLAADRGQVGSQEKALQRVLSSLNDWGVVRRNGDGRAYMPPQSPLCASQPAFELWLLACGLLAHPSEEMAVSDLLRLPDLFPFRFTVGVDHLRASRWFRVQRQGAGWDMVRMAGLAVPGAG